MLNVVLFSITFKVVLGVQSQCSMADIRLLLEGCEHLTGLNLTSVGGTSVNDHNCDVLLPKQVFIEEPFYQYDMADSKKFYTILVVDPDSPPQVDGEFYLHLMKSNIPGLSLSTDTTKNSGVDYRAYKPPSPSRGSGIHRYLNLLFEQADGNNFLPSLPPSRSRLHLANWLRGKNLCGPTAATLFRVQF